MTQRLLVAVLVVGVLSGTGAAQKSAVQSVDASGAPIFKVDPFWPGPLPNRWSMQQVTGIHVDHEDHIWFLNRAAAAACAAAGRVWLGADDRVARRLSGIAGADARAPRRP